MSLQACEHCERAATPRIHRCHPDDIAKVNASRRGQVNDKEKIQKAVDVAIEYGCIDGAHHKTWVIDQILRALLGDKYEPVIAASCAGEDGPNTYEHDVGIAP